MPENVIKFFKNEIVLNTMEFNLEMDSLRNPRKCVNARKLKSMLQINNGSRKKSNENEKLLVMNEDNTTAYQLGYKKSKVKRKVCSN